MDSPAYRQFVQRRPSVAATSVIALAGVAVCAVAARNFAHNHLSRSPLYSWTWRDSAAFAVAVASAALLIGCGLWLARRLPANPTGRRFIVLGFAFGVWLAAVYWNSPIGPWVTDLLVASFRPLLFIAVVAWPTGRLDPRWSRRIRQLLAAYVLLSLLPSFFGFTPRTSLPWAWERWPIPTFSSESVGLLVNQIPALLIPLWAAMVLVAIVHRRRRLPLGARRFTNAAVIAGIVAASADLWLFVSNFLANGLEFSDTGLTAIGTARAVVDYGRFGVVPLLFVADAVLGRRAGRHARVDTSGTATFEVGPQSGVRRASPALAELLGDPTVRVVWSRRDGWVDDTGRPTTLGGDGRAVVALHGADGDDATLAAIEHAADRDLAPTAVEAAAARLQLGLLRSRREAEANARLAELRALQRALLDAQDEARRRLERDLHDGAQQQLVGLALQARLDARGDDRVRGDLADALDDVADLLIQSVADERPVVLRGGLAAALATLASSTPLPTDLRVDGDLAGDSPAALAAWFVASDAVANSLKHAAASHLRIELWVREESAELSIADDGDGGLDRIPRSIAGRVNDAGGVVTLTAPPGGGTRVTIVLPLVVSESVPAPV